MTKVKKIKWLLLLLYWVMWTRYIQPKLRVKIILVTITFLEFFPLLPSFLETLEEMDSELLKCEFCGKMGYANEFLRSKRFCTMSCAKRYLYFVKSANM